MNWKVLVENGGVTMMSDAGHDFSMTISEARHLGTELLNVARQAAEAQGDEVTKHAAD
jgi:hypothetical protein